MKSNKSDTIKKDMITALEKSLGIVSVAVKTCNISRQTHYRWYKEDEDYKANVDEVNDIAIDFAESKLYENIADKKETSIIFYLKSKAKKRGYVERQEIDMGGENHFRIEVIDEEFTD